MNHSIPPHLIQHYKVLELPIGASFRDVEDRYRRLRGKLIGAKRKHVNGQPAFKFLPKLDRAFQVLKQAHYNPDTSHQASMHPLRRMQNASSQSEPDHTGGQEGEVAPQENGNFEHSMTHQSPTSKTRGFVPIDSATFTSFQQPSALNKQPTYKPQSWMVGAMIGGKAPGFAVKYRQQNIFDAAGDRAIVVHAVNCQGVWGMGIAHEIKKRLPQAFAVYHKRCIDLGSDLIGQCLLIPPQPADYEVRARNYLVYSHRRWVACLFTSTGYGKKNNTRGNPGRDPVDQILAHTKTALEDLRMQLEGFGPSNFDADNNWQTDDEKPGQILAVKFNSGAFGVPWESTEALIKEVFEGFERPLYVFDGSVPPEAKPRGAKVNSPWVVPDTPDE